MRNQPATFAPWRLGTHRFILLLRRRRLYPKKAALPDRSVELKTEDSDHRGQVLHLSFAHQLKKAAHRELFEVGGGAMELARRSVTILLINHDHGWVVLNGMRDIAYATRLLARSERQLAQNIANVFTVFGGESHSYDKTDHCASNLPVNVCQKNLAVGI